MSYKTFAQLPNNEVKKPLPPSPAEHFVNPKKSEEFLFELESSEHLQDLLKKHRIIIVDCWANWCGPCKKIAPNFKELALKHKDNPDIIFLKDNIDNPNSHHKELVTAIPTFFMYFEGKNQEKLKYIGADMNPVETNINKILDYCRKKNKK
tara:strand:- start:1134 stop:1586 length:453 start_codon:yes stop_codon:yes gene_type:complete